MNKEWSAILCILLVVSLPLTSLPEADAQEKPEDFDERFTGESILVLVDSYDPTVLPASLLEEDNVPVYVFLKGSTLGAPTLPDFLSEDRLTIAERGDIFYGITPIRKVAAHEVRATGERFVQSVRYRRPRQLSLDNLGYLIVNLRKFPKEADVPNEVVLNMTARIEFDMERAFGIGEQDFTLPEKKNEESWKNDVTELQKSQFFGGMGYLRVRGVSGDSVELSVYDSALDLLRTMRLRIGEVSSSIRFPRARNLIQDEFRVRLNDVVDTQRKQATVELSLNGGVRQRKVVTEGAQLYGGSQWKVRQIRRISEGGILTEEILLEGPNRETRIISKSSKGGRQLLLRTATPPA